MKENLRMFKEWYKLCKPNKTFWFFQFATVIVPSICLLCESMYAAKVTTSLAEGNFKLAIFCLSLGLIFTFLRVFSWILNYKNMYNLVGDSYKRIQKKIYHKIINGKEKNFEKVSKEKLINIFHSDAYETSKFSDQICSRFRFLFSTVLTIVYVFSVNIYVGIGVLIIICINYKILNWINERIYKATKETKEAVDLEFEAFSEIIESKNMIHSYDLIDKKEKEFEAFNENFLVHQQKKNMANSLLDNNFHSIYKTVLFVATLFLVFLLSNNTLTLTVYLIVVAYLSDSITNSKDFMGILTELKNASVTSNRVNIILNFDERETLEFGTINKDDISGEIDFINVSYDATKLDDFPLNDLKNVSFHIKSNETVLIHGARNSGKRTIFYLLRRMVIADSGNIYVDKIKIQDYEEKAHKKNINFLTTKPYFYHGTVIENLKIIDSKKSAIVDALSLAGIYDYLMSLPKKLNTDVHSLTNREQYLIGLARLILTKSEVIILYEFPNYLSVADKTFIKKVLVQLRGKKTIVMFSANEDIADVCDRVLDVERGKVKKCLQERKSIIL